MRLFSLGLLAAASAWAGLTLFTLTNAATDLLTLAYSAYAVAAPASIGLMWWRRRPESRVGTMLMLLATLAAVLVWQGSAFSYPFSFGVLAEAAYATLAIVLCISFPTGRLDGPVARALAAVLIASLLLTFVPWLVSGSEIYGSNPIFACAPACPANAFQLITLQESVRAALAEASYMLVSVIGLAVVGLFISGITAAARPRRRMLGAFALTALPVFPVAALFVAVAVAFGPADAERLGLTVSLAVAVVAFPIGFAVPLISADIAAGNELRGMLAQLTTRPSRSAWRDRVAAALDDHRLRLGYWDELSASYLEPSGQTLARADMGGDRLWVEISHDGQPIAAMATDAALATDPELTDAVAVATVASAAARRLEGVRSEVSGRAAGAAQAERARIAREIDAGPQQRLEALRVHIELLSDQQETAESLSFMREFGRGVDKAIEELGGAARTRSAPRLAALGLGPALRAVRGDSPLTVRIWDRGLGRHPARCELAVYYCVLEAIQNATKHAGHGATVTVRLSEQPNGLAFLIEDDGVGFHPEAVVPGSGLFNIRERIHALGGDVTVSSTPGRGTVISGSIPDSGGTR